MTYDLTAVVKHFGFEGDLLEATPWESGHINDTYVARFRKAW